MSAFVVSNDHIDAMLTAGFALTGYGKSPLRWFCPEPKLESDYERGEPWGPTSIQHIKQLERTLTQDTADCVGAMLIGENIRSVNHRYNEQDDEPDNYHFRPLTGRVNPLVVLKAISCYEYQSCEHPEWEESEAYAFCASLRHRMINQLPGYDDAPGWSIDDRNVFLQNPRF